MVARSFGGEARAWLNPAFEALLQDRHVGQLASREQRLQLSGACHRAALLSRDKQDEKVATIWMRSLLSRQTLALALNL